MARCSENAQRLFSGSSRTTECSVDAARFDEENEVTALTQTDIASLEAESGCLRASAVSAHDEHVGSTSSLRSEAIRASVWTIAGHGVSQVLRFGGSLVLTRLLYPEAFGVMALLGAFMYGLVMFSDVGIGPAIIRDRRGDDPAFVNTAWTIQVIRGFGLWVCCCLITLPVVHFFNLPELSHLLPIFGFVAVLNGFNASSVFAAKRHLHLGRLTALEIGSQLIGLIVAVSWALLSPSVWALVGGPFASAVAYAFGSHVFLAGVAARFHWERQAASELFHFGKWIFLGSAVYFVAQQGDRLFLGHYVPVAVLGVYAIAANLAEVFETVAFKLSGTVLYPILAQTGRREPEKLRELYYRARRRLDIFVLGVGILIATGPTVVNLLYDERYRQAGWILQLLAVRSATCCFNMPAENCLVARGYPVYGFLRRLALMVFVCVGLPIGWKLAGAAGAVWAVALAEIPGLLILWCGLARHRVLSTAGELRGLGYLAIGLLIGLIARGIGF